MYLIKHITYIAKFHSTLVGETRPMCVSMLYAFW